MKQTVKFIIKGKVQGVGFRWSTKTWADKINVKGYVQNLSEGSVKIVANIEDVNNFINGIKSLNNPFIKISNIDYTLLNYKEYKTFSIKI
ncbi:acylphosphatase [Apilactobacillus micheneri]|uniref:acylphosphatase n=1 Tax=Apilactobacillus micheneri TaxID=1899430 RepID=A0ABY2Z2D7_9LACO|nr:acylphosphatase [Apilactobacillus micheneri]TPR25477.1 acylphosphatase [Apilactobacillus micheneri]TPR26581.1 acylphosphatase [Apilactobacillus micheneri]TPR28368.1 acylphosphatase [Apilactobacillus micheneri]TPR29055.1 acylphosphatase [Apilactobacillus micheneri]TPR30644.1 acylphosphatase [Apilactobacillus micheneri]